MGKAKGFFTLPNLLTLLRIVLVPVFLGVYWAGHTRVALLVYAFACLTDVLDGAIARRYNLISRFGQVADPAADKLMTVSVVVSLAIRHGGWLWAVACLLLVKEALMAVGGLILFFFKNLRLVFPAKWIGKAATTVTFCGIVLYFFHEWLWPFDAVVLIIGTALSLAAFFYYMVHNIPVALQTLRLAEQTKQKPEDE